MTNPLDRILGRQPPARDSFSTRAYGTSRAEAAAAQAAAGGAAATTGGSAEAARTSTSAPSTGGTQLP